MPDAPDLFSIVDHYIDELFGLNDVALISALEAAKQGRLPGIQVSASQGKFLYLLAKMVGARRILEIGTLGGYSTIWLARALPADGSLITLEAEEMHARIATKAIATAGLASRVEVIVGPAIDTLASVIERASEPFDLVFLDADKINYSSYYSQVIRRVRSGSLIIADNVIRQGKVLAPQRDDHSATAARAFNAMLAADVRVEAVVLQQIGIKGHDGIAVARVR